MSTRASDSRVFGKLASVLGTLAVVGLSCLMLHFSLARVSRWAERSGNCYPWRDEDYLRFLPPSLHLPARPRIFLAGPSEAREAFLRERFDRAFQDYESFQGAQSLGTFEDLLVTLEYLAEAHGGVAIPRVLVLGITPRFVANLPRGVSPLLDSVDRYSPSYSVERGCGVSRLVAKSAIAETISRARFIEKQGPRYAAGLCTLVLERFGGGAEPSWEAEEPITLMTLSDALALVKGRGLLDAGFDVMRVYITPYRYHHRRPFEREVLVSWLEDERSFWYQVHSWEPTDDADLIRGMTQRLRRYGGSRGTRIFVVNLPEHPMNRERYRLGRYEEYLRIVSEGLGDIPLLDMRTFLAEDEFYDVGHATPSGAARLTARVIEFLRPHLEGSGLD